MEFLIFDSLCNYFLAIKVSSKHLCPRKSHFCITNLLIAVDRWSVVLLVCNHTIFEAKHKINEQIHIQHLTGRGGQKRWTQEEYIDIVRFGFTGVIILCN